MNADEGEAAGLFAVKKDSDFTDLLLRAVTDTRDTDGLADLVHGFARQARPPRRTHRGTRLHRRLRSTCCSGSSTAAEPASRRAASTPQSERRTRALARRLAARARQERGRSAELAQHMVAAPRTPSPTPSRRAAAAP